MLSKVSAFLNWLDGFVWGVPLIVLILATGIFLTIRLRGIQFHKLGMACKYMFQNENEGHGEVSSFAALCTALSATIGTGNIVGVATALVSGGARSTVLDVDRGPVRYGHQVRRGCTGHQVPHH